MIEKHTYNINPERGMNEGIGTNIQPANLKGGSRKKRANNRKRNTPKKNPQIQEESHSIENSIIAKVLRGEYPTDEEFYKYIKELGFQNGNIPEPDELPISPPRYVGSGKKDRCPIGTRRNKDGECVPITENDAAVSEGNKRCPKGQHRNKEGICVPKKNRSDAQQTDELEPEDVQQTEELEPEEQEPEEPVLEEHILEETGEKKKRCPKGQHRNKEGICVPKKNRSDVQQTDKQEPEPEEPILEETGEKKKRCPKGQHRNKEGICVPINNPTDIPAPTTIAEKNTMNKFLEKKEKDESENILKNHDYLYPELNDPEFNIKIAIKKEFRDAQYDGKIRDIEKQATLLCKAKFELSPHQVFVKNFLSSDTPYKGLLLYHGLGTGKTCSAIGVAEEMRQYMKRTGLKQQIIVVASPNVQGNFRQQLFDERKLTKVTNAANPNEFTWNIESCVGNSLLHEINPNSIRNLTRERLISNINSLINENYAFMGYIQFANVARANTLLGSNQDRQNTREQEERNIRRFFDGRLIIIDEVHNIRLADDSNRKEMQQVAAVLMNIVKYTRGLRLLLLSATPMFNSYKEIIWITNLLNANDGRSQIQTSDVFQADGSFKPHGEDLLRRKLTGYVSYVRGENPYTFPYRLYPNVFSPENALASFSYPRIQMNGIEIDSPIKSINVYVNRTEKTTYQMQVYLSIIDYMRRKTHGFYTNAGIYREMPSFENMEAFGYTLLQRPLEALNIVYPNMEISRMLSENDYGSRARFYTDDLFQNAVGGTGLSNVMNFSSMENDEPLKHEYEYKENILKKHGRIFSPGELAKYSVKMAEICNAVKRSEGIVLIYSQYIDGGVVPMALALEEMGLSRYSTAYSGRHRHLFKRAPTSPIDAIQMLPRSELEEGYKFQPAQYIMITGDRGLSPSNTEDVKYATGIDNMDGSKVKVIIISKAGSEGLDFKVIRQIHILEPWFNMNRIEQIIGRGVRNLSHCALPFKKRNVEIYLHSTFIEGTEEEAADLYLYRLAEKKATQIGKVTRLLKESAVDCILNIEQTNFTTEKLSALVANQNIRLELSSKDAGEIREVDFRIGDLSGSEICDYMSCEYQCRPKMPEGEAEDTENVQSYSERNLTSNIYYIISRIRELFRDEHVYTLDQISTAINAVRIYPISQIYYVLSKFVDNRNMVLFDKYGRFGNLINRDKYYVFQPIEITDERSSIRERSVPVEYKRSSVILELPDRVTDRTSKKKVARKPREEENDGDDGVTSTSYSDTIHQIREQIEVVGKPHVIKSTEMNWYKNASKVVDHLHTVYGFDEKTIIQYVIYHYIDSAEYDVKRALFENTVNNTRFKIDEEIERNVASYFRNSIMLSDNGDKEGICIANREVIQLIVREKGETTWKDGDKYDMSDFKTDYSEKYLVDKKQLNDIVGYMIQFKDQDMSFYYKDIYLTRNRKGRRCDRSGGKAPIIDMLNRVMRQKIYTEENTSTSMYSGSLCVILEMLLRKFHGEEHGGNIYYLTPEQAIESKITEYSAKN